MVTYPAAGRAPDVVPVGADQRAYIELAREIAREVNRRWRPIFPIPEHLIPDTGILRGPKMSRSLGNTIELFDDAATVAAKVMRL